MASGWNLWVWLLRIGVVSGYIDILIIIINFSYSTCINSFLAAASLLLCSFLKCFFGPVSVNFLQYIGNVTHRTFEIVQKKSISREYNYLIISREYNYLIISVNKNVDLASTARTRESRDFPVRCTE